MSGREHPVIIDVEAAGAAPPAPGALVPVSARVEVLPKSPLTRPDPSFVTQLIATAEQAPQTRAIRRGSSADALAAYGPHISERRSVTRRTRQII